MACAGAAGTVTVEDQRSYIKIETLRGKNPKEIHSALREVCSEHSHIMIFLSFRSDFIRIFPSFCGLLYDDTLEILGWASEIRRNMTPAFVG
jgi:hypothetical protein